MPEYFGLPEANEQYILGVNDCHNLAVKADNQYVGLVAMNFPYPNNSNVYWMGILRAYQGKGLGGILIKKACESILDKNISTMTVETLSPTESDENYLRTYKFYTSVGFKPLINIKPEGYIWNMVYMLKILKNDKSPCKGDC